MFYLLIIPCPLELLFFSNSLSVSLFHFPTSGLCLLCSRVLFWFVLYLVFVLFFVLLYSWICPCLLFLFVMNFFVTGLLILYYLDFGLHLYFNKASFLFSSVHLSFGCTQRGQKNNNRCCLVCVSKTKTCFPYRNVIPGSKKQCSLHPSIHPSLLTQGWVAWAAGLVSRRPSLQQHFPAPPGASWGVFRPDEICNPSGDFWVCPGVSSKERCPGGILIRCLNNLRWLLLVVLRAPSESQSSSTYLTSAFGSHGPSFIFSSHGHNNCNKKSVWLWLCLRW